MRSLWLLCATLFCVANVGAAVPVSELPERAGIAGGVIVHLGCGDGASTARLQLNESCLVQGLDTDPAKVAGARKTIAETGRYGTVTARTFAGKNLPYVDDFVNLMIAETPGEIPFGEFARVLCPRGVLCFDANSPVVAAARKADFAIREIDGWALCRKPWPAEIDEWTHFLHGPDNNAVAADKRVTPPRSMQWVGGPRYSRHHDKMSSVSAVVTAGGKVFYIMDEAPPVSILTAPKWRLIARDAFNGTILWRRPITKWHSHMHRLKSGPADLPRKLVAVGDRVYTTFEIYGPVSAVDAASGKTVRTFPETDGAEEILVSGGTLFVQSGDHSPASAATKKKRRTANSQLNDPVKTLRAIDTATGNRHWAIDYPVLKGTLAVSDNRVLFVSNGSIVCLNASDGKKAWQSEPVVRLPRYPVRFTPTLVVHDDVILFAGGEVAGGGRGNMSWDVGKIDTLTAFSAETGKTLWKAPHPSSGYASSEDVLVMKGVVWLGETTGGAAVGTFTGYDLKTGKVVGRFDPDIESYWFHHRCHRGKATENFVLSSRTGVEFIDVENEKWNANHWVRGACVYGVMPANGMLYAPQHPCACFLEAKQYGFNALAGERTRRPDPGERLTKGPAYGLKPSSGDETEDWPTFRCDNRRSGMAATELPTQLDEGWSTKIGGRLSAMTVADGRVYVAAIDRHTVYALDAKTGRKLWQYTTGGRVDSPPTYWKGRVLFGSADGNVYCLGAADGVLAWQFRAALNNDQVMSFEQLESAWPVHGSVLIHDDVLAFVAGRSAFLDGGLRLYRLNPTDGTVISTTVLDENDPQAGKKIQDYMRQLNLPVCLPDVLSCDDKNIYMRSQPFTLEGQRLPLEAMEYTAEDPERYGITVVEEPKHAHIFSPTGLLDDTWWHRTYWLHGSHFYSGWAGYPKAGAAVPAGKIIAMDDQRVYGFGRKMKYYRWTTALEHVLFAAPKIARPVSFVRGQVPRGEAGPRKHDWQAEIPLFARGMLLSGNVLFIAGPADIVDEEASLRTLALPETRDLVAEQSRIFAGEQGGELWAVDKTTGEKLASWKLDTIPVFAGMAAAGKRLYISTVAGKVVCMQ